MSHIFASGLVTAAFLGLVFVFGQDTPVSSSPPVDTEVILEDEEFIELSGCQELEVGDLETAKSEDERVDPIDPQPEPTPGENAGTSGNR